MAPTAPLGAHYARCRERLSTLLREHVDDARPVPACPGWTVHDVVSHLVGNIEDGVAGRIKGIPTEEQTADQVERHGEEEMGTLLATWHELGRRSRDQVAALDWSRDPEPVLDHLFVFGPSPLPQEEPG